MNTTMPPIAQGNTLADRLERPPAGFPAVLRCALQLADAFRRDHDNGTVHGVLDPAQVLYASAGAVILEDAQNYLTPYAAPEVLEEQTPDARSDVFVFGCLVYHLLAGRLPFPGETPEAIREAILSTPPAPIDAPPEAAGLVHLLAQCLEKNPELRWQRMQKVYMELKLISVAARRVDPAVAAGRTAAESRMRDEVARVERALTARVGACDQSVVELQHGSAETNRKLQGALDAQDSLRRAVATLEQSVAAMRELTQRLETGLEESGRTTAAVEESFSSQLAAVEETAGVQSQAIESLHTTMAQTDDLLERVVESLDALQSFMLDRNGETPATLN
jgi:eukaryotic-like serine/threonine-protein kinase